MSYKVGSLELRTPIILGSCDLFVSEETVNKRYQPYVGAIVLKTTTREPREGYAEPKIARFGDGILVASGMANPGINRMCQIANNLRELPLIGSVAEPILAKEYAEAGVMAVELNISCPHTPGGRILAHNPETVYSAVREAKEVCNIPVFAKLTGWGCDIVETSIAAEKAGADAIVVSNLFPGTGYYTGLVAQDYAYNVGDCLVGYGHGGYTSPYFLSGVLWMIKQIRDASNIPIIATGGCCASLDSLVQSFMSGAAAVETVTPLYQGRDLNKLYEEFKQWKKE